MLPDSTHNFESLPFSGKQYTPSPSSLPVDERKVLQALGMERHQADSHLLDMIAEYTAECREISTPCAEYSLFAQPKFDMKAAVTYLGGHQFNTQKWVTGFLKKSEYLAVFVGTCGKAIKRLSTRLIEKGDLLEGYVVDLIGSELAEGVAAFIHAAIETDAAEAGLKITNRYSPGYCHWPVSDQQQLFALLGENNCGIHLTSSSLMIPMKSVSGIIGVGKSVIQMGYKCRVCSDENCIMREKD